MATLPGQPGVRHLFRKSTVNNPKNHTCLTCQNEQRFDIGISNGTLMPCEYSEVIVSPGYEAYVQVILLSAMCLYLLVFSPIQHCLGPDIPSTHIFSLPDNTLLWTMDTNGKLQDQVGMKKFEEIKEFQYFLTQVSVSSMPRYEEFLVHLPGTKFKARVKLTLPPVLREEEDFIFPLIVNM